LKKKKKLKKLAGKDIEHHIENIKKNYNICKRLKGLKADIK
jgi:hypothetical protein